MKDWEDVLFGSCASELFTVGKSLCVSVCVRVRVCVRSTLHACEN